MLLEFKMKNFKSFKEALSFSMVPTQVHELEYSIIKKQAKNKEIKGLSSAAVYGPNSSGKTNLIGGMGVLKNIILHGNIRNNEETANYNPNIAVDKLEMIPNIKSSSKEPVCFYIKFIAQDMIIEFKLEVLLGTFMNSSFERKIIEEELKINNKLIYNRGVEDVTIGKIDEISQYSIEGFDAKTAKNIAQKNLDKEELFLNGMFKNLYSKKTHDIIIDWISRKFNIIYHADKLRITPITPVNVDNKSIVIDRVLNEAIKIFGLTSQNIAFPITDKKEKIQPLALIPLNYEKNKGIMLPAEDFESFGTIRFMNIFPVIYTAIKTGATLVVDELDASIHPMAVMNLIKIFHNDEINKKGAQLIFNTHNPIFLNKALFRRDEIKFIEKDEEILSSILYSLSDFGTSGSKGVRNTEDYMKNYFVNKYGAIKDIDFSKIFNDNK